MIASNKTLEAERLLRRREEADDARTLRGIERVWKVCVADEDDRADASPG